MNRIVEVKLTLIGRGEVPGVWQIDVAKEFSPQHGGGSQVFTENGGPEIHEALRRAAMMVTVTPSTRTMYCTTCNGLVPVTHDLQHRENPDPPTSHDVHDDGESRRTGRGWGK